MVVVHGADVGFGPLDWAGIEFLDWLWEFGGCTRGNGEWTGSVNGDVGCVPFFWCVGYGVWRLRLRWRIGFPEGHLAIEKGKLGTLKALAII